MQAQRENKPPAGQTGNSTMPIKLVVDIRFSKRAMRIGNVVVGVHAGFVYLGIVKAGQEFGALARAPDGRFWQVNGDILKVLDSRTVKQALREASGQAHAGVPDAAATRADPQGYKPARARAAMPPTVIVTRRRSYHAGGPSDTSTAASRLSGSAAPEL